MKPQETYEHFELWDEDAWTLRTSRAAALVQKLGLLNKLSGDTYAEPDWSEEEKKAHHHAKTGSYDDPVLLREIAEMGLSVSILDMTEHWMAVVPSDSIGQKEERLPVMVVCLQADYDDHFWAMKTLSDYMAYVEAAAKERWIIIFVVSDKGPDAAMTYVNILQESSARFAVDPDRMYLDVGPVSECGMKLSDIPGLVLYEDGRPTGDPDLLIKSIWDGLVKAVPLHGNWEHRGSLARDLVMQDRYSTADYDRERLLVSETGRHLMQGIYMEYRYDSVCDEELKAELSDMGLTFFVNETKGERWLLLLPAEKMTEKLPLFCIMQEVYRGNEHQAVTALGYFHELLEIAARGECALLFFVLEDKYSNDLLRELIDETGEKYPVDLTRVYVTGHSHDGRYALMFAARHPDRVTGVATLGNFCGLEDPFLMGDTNQFLTDEEIEEFRKHDLPCINLCGMCEHGGKLPVNVDAAELPLRPGQEFGRTMRLSDRISAWQRRLRAWNCAERTKEEIIASKESENIVERVLGFPVDESAVISLEGFDYYSGDIRNAAGHCHLRMTAAENMPHVPTPAMLDLAWDFLRRFARDPESGEIFVRYPVEEIRDEL